MAKLRLLITAGPTREYLDPVRYLSNESSGRMGLAIARAGLARGHRVTLVHGPICLQAPRVQRCIAVTSAVEMLAACRAAWPRHDVLIMCAAVADYAPQVVATAKLKKSTTPLTLKLKPTPDILKTLAGTRSARQRVIGFALEDRDARGRAAEKLRRKKLDAIVLNPPAALSARSSRIEILEADAEWRTYPLRSKTAHAAEIIRLAERLAARVP
jgi:phosphopantothenoylcysteine decarboxylase / phosphopantothenate---cysteine ligase